MLNQAPNIIGVRLKPMMVVLRSMKATAGKATPIIGEHSVVCCQMLSDQFENVSYARSPRDHE
jgi:hypothetical protein